MRRGPAGLRRALVVAVALPALAGCSAALPDASRSAAAATDAQAATLTAYLAVRPYEVHEAVAFARLADGWAGTDVLAAGGDRRDGSLDLLVRVTTSGTYSDGFEPENATDTGCFRITQADPDDFRDPGRVDCPTAATPLALPPAPAPAAIPDGYDERLAAALGRLDPAGRRSEATVAATARQALGGHPARVTTATAADTVGVAVAASRYECVLAAVAPTGPVPTWRPPRVYLQPGEAGCTATAAAHRDLVRPPH
jgi:hypothetical protein